MTRWILGDHATLVDTEDQAALAAAIAKALEEPRKGSDAAKWAHERYSWDVVAGKYIDFFQYVLDRKASKERQAGAQGSQGARA